jgi:hypothetical protein
VIKQEYHIYIKSSLEHQFLNLENARSYSVYYMGQ